MAETENLENLSREELLTQFRLAAAEATLAKARLEDAEVKIKEQARTIKQLSGTAYSDQLTKLPNRHALVEKIFPRFVETTNRSLISNDGRADDIGLFGVILCDIDKFKNFNDTYGHDVGDIALQHFAKIAKDTFRNDTQTAAVRWGGEEFVITFLTKDPEAGTAMAERFRKNLEKAKFTAIHEGQEIELSLTASFGVHVTHPPLEKDEETLGALIKKADKALYEAKGNGRNCVVMYSDEEKSKPEEPTPTAQSKPRPSPAP